MENEGKKRIAVLLMSVGSPSNQDEVEKYVSELRMEHKVTKQLVIGLLKDWRNAATVARAMRKPTKKQMDALRSKYASIGFSPLLEITNRQAIALQSKLSEKGVNAGVYPAMKRLHPSIREVVAKIKEAGCAEVIGIVMFPSYSKVFNDKYEKILLSEMKAQRMDCSATVIKSWDDNVQFLDTWKESILKAYAPIRGERTMVIFTTHSMPKVFIDGGDEYIKNFERTARRLATELMLQDWTCGYYTGGHPAPVKDIKICISESKSKGFERVLLVPLGYVAENMETLYGLGAECDETAKKIDIGITRMHPPNDSEKLINAMAELIVRNL